MTNEIINLYVFGEEGDIIEIEHVENFAPGLQKATGVWRSSQELRAICRVTVRNDLKTGNSIILKPNGSYPRRMFRPTAEPNYGMKPLSLSVNYENEDAATASFASDPIRIFKNLLCPLLRTMVAVVKPFPKKKLAAAWMSRKPI